ncbi:MAG: hypothetical protein AABX10_00050 [Nanoarchaeota archaeon]
MSLLEKFRKIFAENKKRRIERSTKSRLIEYVNGMDDSTRIIQELRVNPVDEEELREFKKSFMRYLDNVKNFKETTQLSRSDQYRFDTAYLQFKNQYEWLFGNLKY